jgi:CubicO group peptidase (beta-lactamase class C family)
MRRTSIIVGLIIVLSGTHGISSFGQQAGTRIGQRFRALDRDGSGTLTLQESQRTRLEFRAIDGDRDGAITLAEATAFFQRAAAGVNRLTPSAEPREILGVITESMPLTRDSCRAARQYSQRANGHAMLVMVDGSVVYEAYDNGWDEQTPHRLASGTKSFAGVAAAAAANDGLLSFDERVSETITEWKQDGRKSRITIRQLLSLTSGIDAGENSVVLQYSDAIKAKSLHPPGTKFRYGPNPFQVFGELMRRKLSESNETHVDYLKRRVFTPIGMETGHWRTDVDGYPHVPSGAFVTAREWAKFGEWLRHKGRCQGQPIVGKDLLEQLILGSKSNPVYGMTFWLARTGGVSAGDDAAGRSTTPQFDGPDLRGKTPSDMYMAAGAGKQRLYVIPSLKMVVVRMGETEGRRFLDDAFLGRLIASL